MSILSPEFPEMSMLSPEFAPEFAAIDSPGWSNPSVVCVTFAKSRDDPYWGGRDINLPPVKLLTLGPDEGIRPI